MNFEDTLAVGLEHPKLAGVRAEEGCAPVDVEIGGLGPVARGVVVV